MFICYFYISVETLIFAKVLEQTRLKNIEFMKTMNYSLIRILFALVIGLVLVIWPNAAASYIVITVGVAFLIPGVISLFGYFGRKRPEGEAAPRFPIEGIGSLLFGLWLIVMPEFFADVLMFLLGFILIMGGVQQIASLSMARRWMPVPGAFYLVPSLILIAGIIALFNPTGARNTAFIIIGISSLVYSLSELINWFKFARRRPKAPVMHDDDDIEDAKIIE